MDENKPRVLVVDDEPNNLRLMMQILQDQCDMAFATNGEEALEAAEKLEPDLILLDVMMPEMDGFAVCERLKDDGRTRDIPIIFLTAKTDADSIVKGFELGAYDYVTKPFISQELLARVRSRLREKALKDELLERYEKIKELEAMRESLTHMIIHDLKNPLSGITGYASLLQINPAVANDARISAHVGSILNCAQIMTDMTMAILDVSRLESGRMPLNIEPVALSGIIRTVVDGLDPLLRKSSLELTVQLPENLPKLKADPEILRRILVNLIGNAILFSPKNGRIDFRAEPEEGGVRLTVTDQGPGIPEEFRDRIFEKFKQIELREAKQKLSTGLGLTFCKMAVESLGGEIGVESKEGKGSVFWVRLPVFET